MNKTILSVLGCCIGMALNAQTDFNNYKTIQAKGEITEDFTKSTFEKLQDDLKKGNEKLNKTEEKIFFEGTNYAIDEILHSGIVVYGDEVTNYINEIARRLLKNEAELLEKLRFYTVKSNSANAFSTNQGILFVTTGLIAQLTSEAQLAFVLAHEIAHYTEKHVLETFEWKADRRNNIRTIERLSQHAKDKEFEADKLGLKMYHDAGYSAEEVLPTFDVLMYSYLPFDEIEFPKSYFNTDKIWIPENLFPTKRYEITAEEDYDDTQSSHPNIKNRKESIEKELGSISNWGSAKDFLGVKRFTEIRNISRFESVRSDIIDAAYGDALYSIFLLEKEFPQSMYLKRMKAQVWLNMMLYKQENQSSKVIKKTDELEGESAPLHFFLKKLNKEGATTLALRQVYDLKMAYPNDNEIQAIYKKFVKDLAAESKFKLDNYSKMSFSKAAEEFMAKSETPSVDTTQKSKSKYDRIKNKKNVDLAENFDSTKFYIYGISDIIADEAFLSLYKEHKKVIDQKEEEDKKYEAMTKKEQKAYDKEKAKSDQADKGLNLKECIVVEPLVYSYKKGEINNVKSEKLEANFSDAINTAAQDVGITTYNIDSRTLNTKGTQGFNERNLLINLLNQLSENEDVEVFPVDFQLLNEIKNNYGTEKVMFSLVEHAYSPNINFGTIAYSVLFYPALFIAVPVGFLTGNNTEITVLFLDLEKGTIDNGINYYFKDAPRKLSLGAHMYDIFNQLSQN